MNAITRIASVTLSVTLGFALAAWAAEPPKSEAPAEVYVSALPWTSSTPVVR